MSVLLLLALGVDLEPRSRFQHFRGSLILCVPPFGRMNVLVKPSLLRELRTVAVGPLDVPGKLGIAHSADANGLLRQRR
jgi:hypothetical protein